MKPASPAASEASVVSRREKRQSFALNVFNGALFEFAERLVDPPLVLTWFVSNLSSSNLLIGLVAPLGDAGWFLPQIFVSVPLQRMERKMPSYRVAAVIRSVSWILLAASVWLIDDPRVLLIGFFLLYALARVMSGLAGLSFFDITAKTVPVHRRGLLFSLRLFLGGILGLGAGGVVSAVLNHPWLPFPRDHAVLFGLYCAATIPALVAFSAIHEPPSGAAARRLSLRGQLRQARMILQRDAVYRRYIAARLVQVLAGMALPFYVVYAKNELRASAAMLGVYVSTRVVTQLALNLAWGWVSDRHGNKLVMRILLLGNGATALLALGLVFVTGLIHSGSTWRPFVVLPLFALDGATRPGHTLVGSNFLLELAPEDERPLYLGLSNTLTGIMILVSGLGGLLVDLVGYGGLFAVSTGLCAAGYALAGKLPEPRDEEDRSRD